ncbi:hypothetical protein QE320_gp171 [Pseudomonas phage EM]|uniref:Uncharacterized protein n=1 Tax=Pseudomonas phage EM TaxID=2936914 RepID=A0AAE9KSJ7_9CAUD|nr:hypothetical protein QE320_gp171 [Pseudomonas phage EM]UPW35883.1 hypothetical protein EM_098 [Pseudomonas phage EM]
MAVYCLEPSVDEWRFRSSCRPVLLIGLYPLG